jgi:trans-2-enoyl-CoA reductase
MKWQICITLTSLPLAYSLLLLDYYVEKNLHETNIKQIVRRYKELF